MILNKQLGWSKIFDIGQGGLSIKNNLGKQNKSREVVVEPIIENIDEGAIIGIKSSSKSVVYQ